MPTYTYLDAVAGRHYVGQARIDAASALAGRS